jgi:hypothetical protein
MRRRPSRAGSGSARGAGRLVRWPRRARRGARPGGPSRKVPARPPRVTQGPMAAAPYAASQPQALPAPPAVDRSPTTAHARGDPKGQSTGGLAEQASKHRARDAGRRRTCGSLSNRTDADRERPFRRDAARRRGPWVQAVLSAPLRRLDCGRTPASRAPSTLPGAHSSKRRADPAPKNKQYGRRSVGFFFFSRSA